MARNRRKTNTSLTVHGDECYFKICNGCGGRILMVNRHRRGWTPYERTSGFGDIVGPEGFRYIWHGSEACESHKRFLREMAEEWEDPNFPVEQKIKAGLRGLGR